MWRTPDGGLIDVTPHRGHDKRILFAPDPGARFDPSLARRRPNHMAALSADPDFVALVAAANALFAYLGALDQAQVQLARNGQDSKFDGLAAAHLEMLHRVYAERLRPTDRCICGSGRKFFRCCRVLPPAEGFAADPLRKRTWVMPAVAGAWCGIDGTVSP